MDSGSPLILTERLALRLAVPQDAAAIIRYYRDNQTHLQPFEPTWPGGFLSHHFWYAQIEKNQLEFDYGHSMRLFLFKRDQPHRVIGSANFNAMIRGAFHGCYLGYCLAAVEQGQGYMTEGLQGAIAYAFNTLNLHRIMANYMPHNQRSANVLKRLGFIVEGHARDYLRINGQWQDHVMTSLTNPHWQDQASSLR